MQSAAIILGFLGVIGLAAFGAVYNHNKVGAIWLLFLPSAVCLLVGTCLQWSLPYRTTQRAPSGESRFLRTLRWLWCVWNTSRQ